MSLAGTARSSPRLPNPCGLEPGLRREARGHGAHGGQAERPGSAGHAGGRGVQLAGAAPSSALPGTRPRGEGAARSVTPGGGGPTPAGRTPAELHHQRVLAKLFLPFGGLRMSSAESRAVLILGVVPVCDSTAPPNSRVPPRRCQDNFPPKVKPQLSHS